MQSSNILALVGLRCSGKSSVGREVAHRLGIAFVDLDDETLLEASPSTERAPTNQTKNAGDLLQLVGVEAFRKWESQALLRVLGSSTAVVLATGGGTVEGAANRALLRERSTCIWLDEEVSRLQQRFRADPGVRPPLIGSDPVSELAVLARHRAPLYQEVADHVVSCSGDEIPAIVERVLALWRPEKPRAGG